MERPCSASGRLEAAGPAAVQSAAHAVRPSGPSTRRSDRWQSSEWTQLPLKPHCEACLRRLRPDEPAARQQSPAARTRHPGQWPSREPCISRNAGVVKLRTPAPGLRPTADQGAPQTHGWPLSALRGACSTETGQPGNSSSHNPRSPERTAHQPKLSRLRKSTAVPQAQGRRRVTITSAATRLSWALFVFCAGFRAGTLMRTRGERALIGLLARAWRLLV
jgi:hypothetical protein